jgi:hypothetical protein
VLSPCAQQSTEHKSVHLSLGSHGVVDADDFALIVTASARILELHQEHCLALTLAGSMR